MACPNQSGLTLSSELRDQLPPRARENVAALGRLLDDGGEEVTIGHDLVRISGAGMETNGDRRYSLRRLRPQTGYMLAFEITLQGRDVVEYSEVRV